MKNKIFCVGLNKTGTSSLHEAFKILGLKSVHEYTDSGQNIKDMLHENYLSGSDILKGLEAYDAYTDWDKMPYNQVIFKEFVKQYPNSKFILNTRDIDGWLNSRVKHVKRNQLEKKNNPDADIKWLDIDVKAWEEEFKKHHEVVFEHFKNREEEMLVFDITKGDGWEKLCPFLEMPIPSVPFPVKNAAPKPPKKRSFYQKVKKRIISKLKKH
jgi:hypothetical protein